ncbi:MAG: NAD(P)-dependent oxidoreductase [Pelagibacteraceae bacterium]|nr:NAD(P)-dependent oxidoreductase [Pelagibacteraceae bacterium]MCI5078835.1 NAD(P)-dependent oxidoreductase [Pelagibacteraceae bacterium]
MKILIPGGAGFIGSVLSTSLVKKGYNVTVVDNLMFEKNSLDHLKHNRKFNFINSDVNSFKNIKKEVNKADVIIPLAALVGAPFCDKNRNLAKKTNLSFIKNLVKSISKDQMLIFPNTNSGYGVGEKGTYCDEKSPLRPVSLYGRLKVSAENEVMEHSNSVAFRLATVFGISYRMRLDLLVNDFVYRALRDRYIVLFEKNFRRNFIHIKDVAETFIYAIENQKKIVGDVYNLGLSSANLTKYQLCNKIKKHIKDLKIILSNIAKDPDKRDYVVSNKKLEKTGWRAKYSLDYGIKELISYLKDKNFRPGNY